MTDRWPSQVQAQLLRFAEARDWVQFHDPRSLLLALVGEVGELAELFQWQTGEEPNPVEVRDEIADVLIYTLRLADVVGVDVAVAVADKIERNELRFPVAEAKGMW